MTSILFIRLVLGSVCAWTEFPLIKVLGYFKYEILITFGTGSTEAVLPRMLAKLKRLGCEKSVVGLVLPTGYAFNADGTCIYLTMAAIFVAQPTNTSLGIGDQLVVLGVLLLTSKGSAGAAGAGFRTLAATLSSIHTVPVAGLVLLLGVDWPAHLAAAGPGHVLRRQVLQYPAECGRAGCERLNVYLT